ncbi:MAG: regulatory protein RecX [Thermodesulfovibrionales bacterium]
MSFRASKKPFQDNIENCLRFAFKLLSYRDRSEREMSDKIALKGFSPKVADEVMGYLRNKGLIDDRKLAENLTRSAIDRCLGPRGIREHLLRRGIPDGAMDLPPERDQTFADSAGRLVAKRWASLKGCDAETRKRRIWGLLSRRGFSGDTIHGVLRSLPSVEEETDEPEE